MKRERDRVESGAVQRSDVLTLRNLTKIYNSGPFGAHRVAVNRLCLSMQKSEVSGAPLLSPPHIITPSHCHTLTLLPPHTVTPSQCHTLTLSHPHTVTPSYCHPLTPSSSLSSAVFWPLGCQRGWQDNHVPHAHGRHTLLPWGRSHSSSQHRQQYGLHTAAHRLLPPGWEREKGGGGEKEREKEREPLLFLFFLSSSLLITYTRCAWCAALYVCFRVGQY